MGQDANVTSLRARLSEGADSMNRSVATGDINGVVMHGKRLEEASAQLREAESIIEAMDTALGGTLPIESAENAIKNLQLSGGHAPGLGTSTYVPSTSVSSIPHSPPVVQSSYS